MKIRSTTSIKSFARVYAEMTTRIYGKALLKNIQELDYLENYTFKGWISDKGCIAAIVNTALAFMDYRPGCIGFFEFENDPGASGQLINYAIEFLREKNCNYCIGPVNGDTWHKYRVTLAGPNGPVFMDNVNPDYYSAHFKANDFNCIADYVSLRIRRGHFEYDRLKRFRPKLEKQNISIRGFSSHDFEGDLKKIYSICVDSFKNNFLYTHVSFEDFRALYRGAESLIHPQYVLLAERNNIPVGFIFAIPNILYQQRKGLVIKTLAVSSDSAARGLGSYMTEMVHETAQQQGIEEIYHLLMLSSNVSTRIASRVSEVYRQYELYGKVI